MSDAVVLKNKAMENEPMEDRFKLMFNNPCDVCMHGNTPLDKAPCERCERYPE